MDDKSIIKQLSVKYRCHFNSSFTWVYGRETFVQTCTVYEKPELLIARVQFLLVYYMEGVLKYLIMTGDRL